jgi:hypothetical protein
MQRQVRHSLSLIVGAMFMALGTATHAQDPNEHRAARVEQAVSGRALAQVGQGTHRDAVVRRMRERGEDAAAAASLVEVQRGLSSGGRMHVRLEQQVGGLTVQGSSVKAAFNESGELVHLVDRLANVPAGAPSAARINERQALDAAMAHVHPRVAVAFTAKGRTSKSQRFAGGAFFHNDPEVTRVLLPQADGSLAEGFLVQTWTQRGNLLDHTVVDGHGAVVSVERRTANDSYNVFAVDPGKGGQTIVSGPGTAGNPQSPSGWLSGAQRTIAISGNNVKAYLDANPNNRADSGGTTVSSGNFTTVANLTQSPSTTANRAVAVQNLFYLNNRIHDILYQHGFNEAAGNFQGNNFAKGGAGNDPVNAEAQDGGGTDNANFSTPADGSAPRMQMYLWSPAGATHEVAISGGPTYGARGSSFGPALTTTGRTATIALVNDGVAAAGGGTVNDGCEAMPAGTLTGRIALVDRGLCAFTVKVKNAQTAGATGVIIANNSAAAIFAAGGTDATVTIPSLMISQADGADLRVRVAPTGTIRLKSTQPPQLDGDLDSDIVYHEYGHGLTWRMIGGMSGPLAGAIGEGASDVVAFMVNGDDVIGEYAIGNPLGIRRFRYAGYPQTYANVNGAEVHADGEIYAAAMWRLRELWLASGRSNDMLFGHFVDGMNYTPSTPKFEHMRNGMLDAINATAGVDAIARCTLVWQAFAQYGIGDGAVGTVVNSTTVTVSPSSVARSNCTH